MSDTSQSEIAPGRRLAIGALLVLAVAAAYAPLQSADFVNFDDPWYVTENPHLTEGSLVDRVRWAFSTDRTGNWHPLTWLSHMIDRFLFGLDPAGHHALNVLLHAANSVLLLIALHKLTGAFWRSAAAAAVFALHPLQVEAVAWIAERKSLLAALFWLFGIIAYSRYARSGSMRDMAAVTAAMLLGAMSKPVIVTFPFALLLLDYWPLQRLSRSNFKSRLVEKTPLFLLSVAICAVTVLVQQSTASVKSFEEFPVWVRFANAAVSYLIYIKQAVIPVELSIYYPHPAQTVSIVLAGLCAAIIAMATLASYRLRTRMPHIITGWLWFLGTLVPMIGLVQVGGQSHADRYMYLPMIGLLIMLVWSVPALSKAPARRYARPAVTCIVLVSLGILTWRQTHVWQDSITLFRHAIAVQPGTIAHNNLGEALLDRGRLDEASDHFGLALEHRSDNAEALNNMGVAYLRLERLDAAEGAFRQLLAARPDHPAGNYNLGTILLKKGNPSAAVEYFQRAIRQDADFLRSYRDLGLALIQEGKFDEAVSYLRTYANMVPDDAAGRLNLGIALAAGGNLYDAERALNAALRADPGNPATLYNLAKVRLAKGELQDAESLIQRVVQADPDDVEARYLLAFIVHEAGRHEESMELINQIMRDFPDYAPASQAQESWSSPQ